MAAGCTSGDSPSREGEPTAPLAGVRLRLVVADDPALARAVRQLQGEWNAQTSSVLEVEETTEKTLGRAESLSGDALICPSHAMGVLAERKLLAPVPDSLLRANAGDWSEVFEQLRLREAAWGGRTMAVPLGSPVLVCYYRADLLEKIGRKPPQTWTEYQELAKLLQGEIGKEPKGDSPPSAVSRQAVPHGVCEPLGPGWAGLVLLARAAPYAKHRDNYSTLFDIATMQPLVAGPPFQRALTELVEAAKTAPEEQIHFDPTAARAAFWQGQCGMALSWPTAAEPASLPKDPSFRAGFAPLPGSDRVYNVGSRKWEPRSGDAAEGQVPLLGVSGRLGVVASASENQEAAFRLLLWLSGPRIASQVSAASPATTLFRKSHAKTPRDWVEKPVAASAAASYAGMVEQTFRLQQSLPALPIPGRSEYLSALDAAVQSAVRGEKPPAEALEKASTQWKGITTRLGLESQKTAYLHSLGLE